MVGRDELTGSNQSIVQRKRARKSGVTISNATDTVPRFQPPLFFVGLLLVLAGLLLFLRLQPGGSDDGDLLPGIILPSIGMGLPFVPVTLIATSGISSASSASCRESSEPNVASSTTPNSVSLDKSGDVNYRGWRGAAWRRT